MKKLWYRVSGSFLLMTALWVLIAGSGRSSGHTWSMAFKVSTIATGIVGIGIVCVAAGLALISKGSDT